MTDTTRDAFEAWFTGRTDGRCLIRVGDGYTLMSAQTSWMAWQAATLLERERCAQVCDKISDMNMGHVELQGAADAIRGGK